MPHWGRMLGTVRGAGAGHIGMAVGGQLGGQRDSHGGPDPTQDPYNGGANFNEQGFPDRLPYGPRAVDYQFLANKQTEAQRQVYWNDAQNQLRQGMDLFQSYRPGGAQALASGLYQQSS